MSTPGHREGEFLNGLHLHIVVLGVYDENDGTRPHEKAVAVIDLRIEKVDLTWEQKL